MMAIYIVGGLNRNGILGNGKKHDLKLYEPKQIENTTLLKLNNNIKAICCGFDHNLALTNDGDVFTLNSNFFGQIGVEIPNKNYPNYKDVIIPTKVEGFENNNGKAISCEAKFSMALTENGHV
jgi:alpha-tubulin suppressor-like RCC1 family protein